MTEREIRTMAIKWWYFGIIPRRSCQIQVYDYIKEHMQEFKANRGITRTL